MAHLTPHRASAERYIGLGLISGIFTVLGALLVALSSLLLAFCLYAALSGSVSLLPKAEVPFPSHPVGVVSVAARFGVAFWSVWSFGLLIGGLQFAAMGAVCRLLIDVEENTRISAECLERLVSREEPFGQNAGSIFRS